MAYSDKVMKARYALTQANISMALALSTLGIDDIEAAFAENGMTDMKPLWCLFKGINNGKCAYECRYWDDEANDGTLTSVSVYVWFDFAEGKIKADT